MAYACWTLRHHCRAEKGQTMSRLFMFLSYPFFLIGYGFGWALQAFLVGMLGAKEHITELIQKDSK